MWCRRRTGSALLGLAGIIVGPDALRAETITASATTLVSGRQDPRDGSVHTVVPFLELVTIDARDVKNPLLDDLSLVMSGWGEAVAGDPRDGKRAMGDVDLAYVEGSLGHRRLDLRLGRHFVMPGAGAGVQLDGLSARVRLDWGFGLAGYFGSPVTPRFAFDRGDVVAGGRLFWRRSYASEIGLSFIELRGQGEVGRRDAVFDLRNQIVPTLALSGLARWSLAEARLAEGDAALTWQPHRTFDISAGIRRTAPDLFLPRYSLFSVFAQDRRDEAGGFLSLRPFRLLELLADFRAVRQNEGWGLSGSAKLAFRLNDSGWTRFGAEVRRLDGVTSNYLMYRLYAWRRLGGNLGTMADLQMVNLERPINGQTKSYYATASAVWDYTPTWRVVLTGIACSTPYAKQGYEGLLKIVYNRGRTIVQESRP